MSKLLIALLCFSSFLFSGCTPESKELNFPVLPVELKDCKFYMVRDGLGNVLSVVRCPNSSTSATTSGKSPKTVIVIEGGRIRT